MLCREINCLLVTPPPPPMDNPGLVSYSVPTPKTVTLRKQASVLLRQAAEALESVKANQIRCADLEDERFKSQLRDLCPNGEMSDEALVNTLAFANCDDLRELLERQPSQTTARKPDIATIACVKVQTAARRLLARKAMATLLSARITGQSTLCTIVSQSSLVRASKWLGSWLEQRVAFAQACTTHAIEVDTDTDTVMCGFVPNSFQPSRSIRVTAHDATGIANITRFCPTVLRRSGHTPLRLHDLALVDRDGRDIRIDDLVSTAADLPMPDTGASLACLGEANCILMSAAGKGVIERCKPGPGAVTRIHGVGGVSKVLYHVIIRLNFGGRHIQLVDVPVIAGFRGFLLGNDILRPCGAAIKYQTLERDSHTFDGSVQLVDPLSVLPDSRPLYFKCQSGGTVVAPALDPVVGLAVDDETPMAEDPVAAESSDDRILSSLDFAASS